MPRIEMALWHPRMSLNSIIQEVDLPLRIGWSAGDVDAKSGRVRDRTYARFPLEKSYASPKLDLLQIIGNFSGLLTSITFSHEGRAILYVNNNETDGELLIDRTAMSLLSRLGVELALR